MKKYFYSFFAAVAMMLAVTSCSQEDVVDNGTSSAEEVQVSFNIAMEGQNESRAIGDGLTVNEVIMNVFSATQDETTKEWTIGDFVLEEKGTVDNHNAVVKTHLVKGQAYAFVFWAQVAGNTYYTFSTDKKTIIVSYDGDANDEKRDAFYAYEQPYKVTGSFSKNITLKRPFAQLNLGTTKEDIEYAKRAGVVIAQSSVKVEGAVYNQLNTLTGKADNAVTVQYTMANIPDATKEELVIDDDDLNQFENDIYEYLASDYLLANESSELSTKITYVLCDENGKDINTLTIENAPLQRNWRTNIVGEIITGEGTFNIVIDPIFDADRNYPMDGSDLDIWDGTKETPAIVNKMIVIEKASQFLGLSDIPQADLNGVTIELKKDLSFKSKKKDGSIMSRSEDDYDTAPATIEPLFKEDNGVSGMIFNGNDHVIRDFVIDGDYDRNSLFGQLTGSKVQNLTIINADVTGVNADHKWAAIVAAKVVNSTLENVTVKDSKLIGVQKTGALIGYVENDGGMETKVVNCTVEGLELSNHDHEEAGSTGGLIGCINGGANSIATIENSYVKNSTLNLIYAGTDADSNVKRANSEFIGVIRGSIEVTIFNCGVDEVKMSNEKKCNNPLLSYCSPFVGGNAGATLYVNVASSDEDDFSNLSGNGVIKFTEDFDNTGNDAPYVQVSEGNWEFEGGSVKTGSAKHYGFIAEGESSSATYDNVDITSNGGGIGAVNGATVTFNSGSVYVDTSSTSGRYIFYAEGEGTTITINEGKFSWDPADNQKRAYIYASAGTTVYVKGGTFGEASTRSGYTAGILGDGTVIITGGTFGFDPSNWVADGYEAVKNGSTWTVSAK